MQAKKVDVLLPLLAFDSFAFWLSAADKGQQFYPRYLLSDFEQELVIAQALLGARFPKSLEHAQGPTFARLGSPDFPPKYPAHYSATEARCEAIWHREHVSSIVVAGIAMRWCESINLFVEAAQRAGPNLTRLRWAQAMSTIHDFGGAMTPTLTYGPNQYAGPTQMEIVDTLTGQDNPNECPAYLNGTPCTVILEPYAPIRHF
jgi:hypothetical protein